MPRTGRPSDYTIELSQRICELIADGMALHRICEIDGMPKTSTVFQWLARDEDFADRYARAVATRSEKFAEEIVTLSDQIEGETDRAKIEATRLRVDARKWVAARLLPNKYGDRTSLAVSGDLNLAAAVKDAAKLLKREPGAE